MPESINNNQETIFNAVSQYAETDNTKKLSKITGKTLQNKADTIDSFFHSRASGDTLFQNKNSEDLLKFQAGLLKLGSGDPTIQETLKGTITIVNQQLVNKIGKTEHGETAQKVKQEVTQPLSKAKGKLPSPPTGSLTTTDTRKQTTADKKLINARVDWAIKFASSHNYSMREKTVDGVRILAKTIQNPEKFELSVKQNVIIANDGKK